MTASPDLPGTQVYPADIPPIQKLRKALRARRRTLPDTDQRIHSQSVLTHLQRSQRLLRHHHIAVYLATDGEVNLTPIIATLLAMGKRVYLPVLRARPQRALWFAEYRPGDRLYRNRFGIGEPDIRKRKSTPPWRLDLILMPLVGFDGACNRIGMGGGFYDRTLAFKRRRRHWHKPLLIGIAHECQRVPMLRRRPWDIPLDAVVSEAGIFLPKNTQCLSETDQSA